MSKLKLCPFCGKKPKMANKLDRNGDKIFQVQCSCLIVQTHWWQGTRKAAAAVWNRRPTEAKLQAEVDRLGLIAFKDNNEIDLDDMVLWAKWIIKHEGTETSAPEKAIKMAHGIAEAFVEQE